MVPREILQYQNIFIFQIERIILTRDYNENIIEYFMSSDQMTSTRVTIREYKPEDAQPLATIYYNTIHKVKIQHYTQEQVEAWAPGTSLDGEDWKKKFEKTRPLVAVADEQVVGFAEFESNGHIDCFYCHHEWIGCGVGSALMNAIHEQANRQGIKLIFSEVSITAKPFFERQGFTTITEQTVVLRGVELTNYRMEKLLGDAGDLSERSRREGQSESP